MKCKSCRNGRTNATLAAGNEVHPDKSICDTQRYAHTCDEIYRLVFTLLEMNSLFTISCLPL